MRFLDHDPDEVLRILREAEWPLDVRDWQVEIGQDSQDEPAVWVWAILDRVLEEDGGPDIEARNAFRYLLQERVIAGLDPPPEWVYVRFRSTDEVAAL